MRHKTIKNTGFTLIEMIVSMFVFSLIVGAGSGLLISAIRAQNRTLAIQQLLDQTSYALEYMSRAIRMAGKEKATILSEACLTQDSTILYGYNYELTREGKGIKFINNDIECQEFFLDETTYQLMESKNGGAPSPLTSEGLYVENFKIGSDVSWGQDGSGLNLQPGVTIFLEIRRAGLEPEKQPKIKIQTTVSQRRLDIFE